ncbi:MAG TPA: hypothetical protein VFU02_07135 [Polyangiaceae bacterium]|nr:hypothetical protein [Polyangiaceae bacterium]
MRRTDAHQRRRTWFYTGLALVGSLPMAMLACGSDDSSSSDTTTTGFGGSSCGEECSVGGSAGADGGSDAGGSSSGGTTSTGGAGGTGEAGGGGDTNSAGGSTGGSGDTGGTGGTGGTPATGNIDEVVAAICGWEFRCCDEGERNYRLSPFATDAASCTERLVHALRESNATDNPYLSGPAAPGGLLGTLGYVVDLDRVTPNEAGIIDCVESWNDRDCNAAVDVEARCEGPSDGDPCALTNLFSPKLLVGDECTLELAETGATNDVECEVGSTCLDVGEDNPNDVPTCVSRGLADDPCISDVDCDFNHYCDSGNCAEKAGPGEACSYEDPDDPVPGEYDVQCAAGLFCHPLELECMEPCGIGSSCGSDISCPTGSGCAPLEVNESSDTFTVCTDRGDSAEAACNSDADCTNAYYCDGANCQADKTAGVACAAHNECAAGLHCDLANLVEITCVTNLAAGDTCTAAYQCGPNSAGCLNEGVVAGSKCRNNLLANETLCGSNADCASARCEVANTSTVDASCVAGADEGDACDSLTTDGTAQSCAPGLICFGSPGTVAGGTCEAQAAPGTDCENPNGDPDDTMCANGSICTDPWDEGAICSDAAVSEPNGGSGIACDGN